MSHNYYVQIVVEEKINEWYKKEYLVFCIYIFTELDSFGKYVNNETCFKWIVFQST